MPGFADKYMIVHLLNFVHISSNTRQAIGETAAMGKKKKKMFGFSWEAHHEKKTRPEGRE